MSFIRFPEWVYSQNEMHFFHMNLMKIWFDMILSGEKKEEYRKHKPFYDRRIDQFGQIKIGGKWVHYSKVKIIFSNGYKTNAPRMIVDIIGMRYHSGGKKEWGAVDGEKYIVFELGKVHEIIRK